MKRCHPGAAQQSPGSITADEAERGATLPAFLEALAVMDPRLRGDDSMQVPALPPAHDPGSTPTYGMTVRETAEFN